MTKADMAVATFKEGFCCAQSVLTAFAPSFGLDKEMALRLGTAFGGGIGRSGETCGALIGSYLVIGLKHGRIKAKDKSTKEENYVLVKEFTKRFKAANKGNVTCRDLLGCDKSTEEGREIDRQKNITQRLCPKFVKDAVDILEEILSLK